MVLTVHALAQVNTGGTSTTANHQKQIIGYITNWDPWKSTANGVPSAGALTHLDIDYSKYTILNFSFFGVAKDGSLHSGDFRNKNIYQAGAVQEPADIFYTDVTSSWDLLLLFGEIENIQYISQDAANRCAAQGFQVTVGGSTWSQPTWGLYNKPLPVPLHKEGGAPGILELAHQKGVKVVASIGGWSMCKHFPEMAADPAKRAKFIADCKKLINVGFDGIDLDWEYPGPFEGMNFTGTQADFANFTTLVQEIRQAIGNTKLITAAMSASATKLQGFQWSTLSNTMNYFNIMTYDFNGGWSAKAGHNAPLYDYPGAEASNWSWNAAYTALVSYGVPASKINMGAPFYGRGVVTNGTADLNAATVKTSMTIQPDGPVSTAADYANWGTFDGTPYYEYIRQNKSSWAEHWDDNAKVPYLTKGNYFLSYDNEQSIGLKAQYVVDKGLAGVIVWTVAGDLQIEGTVTDFSGKLKRYSSVKSPLVNKLNDVFAAGSLGIPTISITSPANGAQVTSGTSVTINAIAADPGGSVIKVEFFLDGNKINEDVTSPYSFTITSIASGSHTILAKVTDNSANTATSSVTITSGTANVPPTGSITSPPNNSSFASPANITIIASASDSDGAVSKVEFYNGASLLGSDSSSPYSYDWANVGAGTYSLTVKVTDNLNAVTTSSAIAIVVTSTGCTTPAWISTQVYNTGDQASRNGNKYQAKWWTQGEDPALKSGTDDVWKLVGPCGGGNVNPTTSITSPAANALFTAPAAVTINATAIDSDGTITKVEFYNGSTLLGTDTSSPYGFTWTSVAAGTYPLTSKATDNAGGVGVSSVVSITVTSNNVLPSTSITSPANNISFTAPASITINANATDGDGTISKVDFYSGSTLLGTDTTSPYSFSWTNVAAGSYALTSKATDNAGGVTTSLTVNIVVNSSSGTCSGKPQYVENGGYVAGSQVQNFSNLYECKPYPYSGWCNGAAWAYAPGTGTYWTDAWVLKGSCSGARLSTEAIENNDETKELTIYPNPGTTNGTSVTLAFETEQGTIDFNLYSMDGLSVITKKLDGVKKSTRVELPEMKSGLYVIRVASNRKTWLRKYLVK